jgi:hypothetical protein
MPSRRVMLQSESLRARRLDESSANESALRDRARMSLLIERLSRLKSGFGNYLLDDDVGEARRPIM